MTFVFRRSLFYLEGDIFLKKIALMLTGVLLLVACHEQQVSKASESVLEEVGAASKEKLNEVEPKKVDELVEQQMLERLNSFQFISLNGEVKKGQDIEKDFSLILNLVRSFPKEVPIVAQGEKFNGFYEWYRPEQINAAMLKYHGYEIDFEQYRYNEENENQHLIFDEPYVYLASADYPGFLGHQEIDINNMGNISDKVYTAEYQIQEFLAYEYEEATGESWDPAFAEVQMDQWPKEMKLYIHLNPTKHYAMFVENEYGLALVYLGKEPLTEVETAHYLQSLLDETTKQQVLDRLHSLPFVHSVGDIQKDESVESDFNILVSLTRSFPEEVPMIAQGKKYNSFYETYSVDAMNEAMLKYHGFEINFEKYLYDKKRENQNIIYDEDYVYLVSADYPGTLGYETPILYSIEPVADNGYAAEFRYLLFDSYKYEEETGKVWDSSYTDMPMEEWPDDMKAYMKLEPTKYYALFVENEFGLALAYLGKEPLKSDEATAYLNDIQ